MIVAAGATIEAARHALRDAFRAANIDAPNLDARVLVGHVLGLDHAALTARANDLIGAKDAAAIETLATRRLAREPIARITGQKEFWSLPLRVTADTLVPRPETETVVEAALEAIGAQGLRTEKLRVLDIGVGSGALLLALLSELPKASGTGIDISEAALNVARDNAEALGLAARCEFLVRDIALMQEGPFDIVVSNPPYVASGHIASLAREVRDYDPRLALDGGPDGLACYRVIAAKTPALLAPGGRLIVELGAGQEKAVAALFTQAGLLVPAPARKDIAGIPRALSVNFAP
ncbi:MAG: peptide chain release factor N(5)-glutamine methyltransferase [Hyphomicrobiales bacterium]